MATTPILVEPNRIFPLPDCIFTVFWPLWRHKWSFWTKGPCSKIDLNFFHSSMYILGCCEEQFYGNHAHLGRTKYDFSPPRLYFYTILTIMTSQMVILLIRNIHKNCSNYFYNSIHIIGRWQVQCFGNHTHVSRTKNDFPLQDCIFTLFWPLWRHKWPFFSEGPSSKIGQTFFTTPCIS